MYVVTSPALALLSLLLLLPSAVPLALVASAGTGTAGVQVE
jgi:hypothetical protein